ncbi:uncharacterized protein EI90DRAFT_1515659 [Cantharellus anzutake]|uniref:uncharacterized protein n=1 Tax=Cantharellus anzutake TaxID=1750568 RepID=UPI001908046D|nr:uncharacterized protein EI90DRAFT_1515659 [Cantharellus anzutake]KAF8328696.1 hypothetical protein EI90DRAFT_1515659 [Cantharellus anzutake]
MTLAKGYRHLLRELRKYEPLRHRDTKKVSLASFRATFERHKSATPNELGEFLRTINNAALFLKSQREYDELLARYNPLQDVTSEEHVKATANRVGLNMPPEFKRTDA